MATVAELVAVALRVATHHVAEGSRRNARQALEVRYELVRQGSEVLAAVPAQASRRTAADRLPRRAAPGPAQHRTAG